MRVPAAGVMTTSPMPPATLQAYEEQRRGAAVQLLGGSDPTSYVIASGAFKPTTGLCAVDTEASAASDDLDRLTAESTVTLAGFPGHGLVILRAANTARTVVVRHLQGAVGSSYDIELATSSSFSLDDDAKRLVLELRGTRWYEVDRFYAADSAARRTALDITSLATLAAPANPGDDGKLVTASGGGWVYAAPPSGGHGFASRSVSYAGGSRNYANGAAIRFEETFLGTPNTDGYVFIAPANASWLQFQAMLRVEQQNEPEALGVAIPNTATVRLTLKHSGMAAFDETGLFGARGLPAKSFLFQKSSEPNRLREANISLASGLVKLQASAYASKTTQVRVQVHDYSTFTDMKVNGGRTKCWLALQWM